MKIDIINVPLFYGCDRPGVEFGPAELKKNEIIKIFENNGNEIVNERTIDIQSVKEEDKFRDSKTMKYLNAVVDANTKLAKEVQETTKEGRLAFTVGGDHSLGMGTIAGTTSTYGKDMAVIWIDAHADINTPETSPSGNIHGMPFAASMGVGPDELTSIYTPKPKINSNNAFILGARSVDDGEVELIDEKGINVWYMEEIRDKGMGIVIEELMEILKKKGIKDIHISYDIDSMDSSLVPGTGTPVENGMLYDESEKLIEAIIGTGLVRSIDFVEFNPKRDKEDKTLKSCLKILECYAKALGKLK